MELSHYFSLMVPLGLAGFDPAPLFVALYYLSRHPERSSRRTVLGFSALILLGTAAWGLFLANVFGELITHLPWRQIFHFILSAGWWTVLAKVVIGLGALIFGVIKLVSLHRGTTSAAKEKPKKDRSASGLVIFALIFIVVVTGDVAFAAFAAAAASQPVWAQVVGLLGWSCISQFPLVFFVVALLLGKEQIFSRVLGRAQDRLRPIFAYAVPYLCVVIGLALIADGLLFPLVHVVLIPWLHG